MSILGVAETIIGIAYPPAAPLLAKIVPIVEALWNNREEIAAAVNAAKPAIEAIKEAAPQVLPHLEDLAEKVMKSYPGKSRNEVTRALATKAVGALVPGWKDEAATSWMNMQNAIG